ncbi:MFS transporter [Chryseobacterium nematophagum]|uniref:MFS transporter n=1 Tax=Chryseobacterium nematophagum TaxID=2305228 RepID=A0A3M7L849_9FLAO|nr:MFS transporter [Chryseobacterium nematophagum]RMZ58130.1 MFS transporter [Chryseobacterium nematophagum]
MSNLFTFYFNAYKGLTKESWMLSFVMLIYRSGSMVLPFLGVYLTEKLGLSLQESGILLSSYGLGAILGSYLGGKMVDKIGYFKVQIISLLLSVPGLLLIPEIKNFYILSIVFFLQSTFNETFLPANSVAITKYSSPENRARAFSLNRLALNLGFFIGPFFGGLLSSISYHLIFYVNAIAALISGIIMYLFFRNNISDTSKNKETTPQDTSSPYKDKNFLIFILFCIIYAICLMQLFNTLPLFYKHTGLSKAEIGMIFGYCGLLLFIVEMPLVKWITKVLNIIHIVIVGLFLLFTGYFILVFFSDIYLIIISITCISISNILVIPFLSTITSIRAEGKNIGSYMGLFGAIFSTALFISPFLGTFLAQNYGFRSLWLVVCILIIISITGIYFISTKKITNSI